MQTGGCERWGLRRVGSGPPRTGLALSLPPVELQVVIHESDQAETSQHRSQPQIERPHDGRFNCLRAKRSCARGVRWFARVNAGREPCPFAGEVADLQLGLDLQWCALGQMESRPAWGPDGMRSEGRPMSVCLTVLAGSLQVRREVESIPWCAWEDRYVGWKHSHRHSDGQRRPACSGGSPFTRPP